MDRVEAFLKLSAWAFVSMIATIVVMPFIVLLVIIDMSRDFLGIKPIYEERELYE